MKPMKTTSYNILLKLSTQGVRNGSVQFTAILHLRRLFILSSLGGTFSMKFTQLFCSLRSLSYLKDAIYGVEEAWYFTNAIAASSLQNSSNTITPSSNVMWSILLREKQATHQFKLSADCQVWLEFLGKKKKKSKTLTYTGPSGSKASNRFLTNRSLGVKS